MTATQGSFPMRTFITTLTLGLSLAAVVHADGIYRWVDEQGVVHFSSHPPQKEGVEVVKAPKSARFRQWQQEQDALAAQRALATASKPEDAVESTESQQQSDNQDSQQALNKAEMAAREQRCRNAQQHLHELESHARVREVDASGNYRVLPEEERQQRIRQAKQTLQNNC
ncbi:DUF4124 domain-containing protein [Microbulbifer bruguierae]|uniref:DUF4124 domain-containing protein n=1 Tax=Microbulbifer bruguierae TaxID=3029061 RepID=A0ABY8NHK2_9GAMM|nr:DUF4124 domain-containing protein [Microbulbifer bruguierae]WGL18175.1 DUF4124 domain-containing protein [Microbulbifer bruguierae]